MEEWSLTLFGAKVQTVHQQACQPMCAACGTRGKCPLWEGPAPLQTPTQAVADGTAIN